VTFPTRERLISNHFATIKVVPLTCCSMVTYQSRNGDNEGSYLGVICSEMIHRKCAPARRGPLAGDTQERFAANGMLRARTNSFCLGAVTKSDQVGQAETKRFAEYAW